METTVSKRLGSVDVLRGFDLFCLVFLEPIITSVGEAVRTPLMGKILTQFNHVAWEGFAFWDIIMPLFLFMAGVSMPFSFAKYAQSASKRPLYARILKRVMLLWIFGMMCQGNLLALDSQRIYLFSNTLQAIAIGYLFSSIFLLHCGQKTQIADSAGLLLLYWVLLTFVKVDGFGGGDFTPDGNLAEYVDRVVLGRFRDASTVTPDGIDFGFYRYTWIVSSLNFIVTVMSGAFAGQILKGKGPETSKIKHLCLIGVSLILAGLAWSVQMPIIKTIWTSSMTLFSSGICFLLMALFYYLIDYNNYGMGLGWLKIFGMNSILAYMLSQIVDFSSVVHSVFYGCEQFLGSYYPVLVTIGNVTILFAILLVCYRNKLFLKV